MTDRELLELAAKAIRCTVRGKADDEYYNLHEADDTHSWWNPLTDDGDALRLAIKLYFAIKLEGDCVYAIGCEAQNYQLFEWHKDDPYAATRRAIVRAAAAIGKEMK